jgi:hypothetical protein
MRFGYSTRSGPIFKSSAIAHGSQGVRKLHHGAAPLASPAVQMLYVIHVWPGVSMQKGGSSMLPAPCLYSNLFPQCFQREMTRHRTPLLPFL